MNNFNEIIYFIKKAEHTLKSPDDINKGEFQSWIANHSNDQNKNLLLYCNEASVSSNWQDNGRIIDSDGNGFSLHNEIWRREMHGKS